MSALLHCSCLGDKWFGKDVDSIFAYATPQVAIIKDRSLGVMKTLLMLMIFSYIVVFNIFYKGKHFKREVVNGLTRMQLQEPTKSCNPFYVDCMSNFSSLEKLPYCHHYAGGSPLNAIKDCNFYDALELPIDTPSGIMMPSYRERYQQTQLCRPSAENGFTCDRKYAFEGADDELQRGHKKGTPSSAQYVADLEDFTILLDHSFRTPSGLQFDDYKMQGYWMDCFGLGDDFQQGDKLKNLKHITENKLKNRKSPYCVERPIGCNHRRCKDMGMKDVVYSPPPEKQNPGLVAFRRSGLADQAVAVADANAADAGLEDSESADASVAQTGSAAPTISSIKYGDVVSIGTLLAMAGRSLDEEWQKDGDGEWQSLRSRGGAIVLDIDYHNMVPWTVLHPQDPPEYTVSVSSRPVYKYKHATAEVNPEGGRTVNQDYGILIIIRQSGEIGVLDVTTGLIVLTTALGLLAVANTLTDLIAFNLMPKKDIYKSYKFSESKDFNPDGGEKS